MSSKYILSQSYIKLFIGYFIYQMFPVVIA